ncbi:Kae1-associated serine/threonine protein kinase [Candidatus Woesearchaeota archaeon]|nr:Kae1-associated serine/threonine protein kinase [Candidatus Woesearchaeota archaeon]
MKLLSRGAEAEIFLDSKGLIHKFRVVKNYRHKDLDNVLRFERSRKEANILRKALKIGLPVPRVFEQKDDLLIIEKISGVNVASIGTELSLRIAVQIAEILARMHDENIIHGDLTTSNIILGVDEKLYIIDFGLGTTSTRIEDKAVDLHVLEESLEARHPINSAHFFEIFCEHYKKNSSKGRAVIQRLQKVRSRGRNKLQV